MLAPSHYPNERPFVIDDSDRTIFIQIQIQNIFIVNIYTTYIEMSTLCLIYTTA